MDLNQSLNRRVEHLENEVISSLASKVKRLKLYLCERLELIDVIPEKDVTDILKALNCIHHNYKLRLRSEVKRLSSELKIDMIHAFWESSKTSFISISKKDQSKITTSKSFSNLKETDSCYESLCSEAKTSSKGPQSLELDEDLLEVRLWLLKREIALQIWF